MKIQAFHVNAFTNQLFSGNPAMVCRLDHWLDEATLQAITVENQLPVTAFFIQKTEAIEIRWFSRKAELDLCGHGTLAASYVLFNYLEQTADTLHFKTKAGLLKVTRNGELITMSFPAQPATPCDPPPDLLQALNLPPKEVLRASKYVAVYESEEAIRVIRPNLDLIKTLYATGVIVSAPGKTSDIASRYFAPKIGIDEDVATGSAHCILTPYWAKKLGKSRLHARQLSARGGEMWCEDLDDRVKLSAQAVLYGEGVLYL